MGISIDSYVDKAFSKIKAKLALYIVPMHQNENTNVTKVKESAEMKTVKVESGYCLNLEKKFPDTSIAIFKTYIESYMFNCSIYLFLSCYDPVENKETRSQLSKEADKLLNEIVNTICKRIFRYEYL